MGIHGRGHRRSRRAARRAPHRREPSTDPLAGAAADGSDRARSLRRAQSRRRGEQLQRPVRALLARGDRHRGRRIHPQVRRRAVPAPPRGERRGEDPRRCDDEVRAGSRNPGLRRIAMGEMQIESRTTQLGRQRRPALTVKDFKGKADPDWCPGCGDFGVLNALKTAVAELGLLPHEVLTISGIGCSSNLPGYINTYGMHTLHGRALAVATGAQLGNHDLKILVTGGDGDGFGIGGNHFVHVMRRNVDLTYIVMDNQIYGLTTGQVSPTSRKGMKTKSTPHGSVENPVNPIPMAIVCGATYVARGFSGQQKQLVALIKGAIEHRGFAFVDVFSPCVTYNHDNTHEFFKQRTRKLEEMGHDPADRRAAIEKGGEWGETIPIGLFYKNDDVPSLDELEPVLTEGGALAHRPLEVSSENARALVEELL